MLLYLAGPMRGYDKFNFDAFDSWKAWLEEQGHKVISPADLDRDKYEEPEFDENKAPWLPEGFMARAMRRDVKSLLIVDGIALMPKWEESTGTTFEKSIADNLGLKVLYLHEGPSGFKGKIKTGGGVRWCTEQSAWMKDWQVKAKDPNDPSLEALLAEEEELERQAGLRKGKVREEDKHLFDRDSHDEVRVTNADTGGQKGQKLARFDLIPPGPLRQLAEHYGRGAAKYADRNWEKGIAWNLNFAAMQRHAWDWWEGEDLDPDTGGSHLAAIAWHAFSLMEYSNTHTELDNRP